MLLALGMATTTRETVSGWGGAQFQVRHPQSRPRACTSPETVGFIGGRKAALLELTPSASRGTATASYCRAHVWLRARADRPRTAHVDSSSVARGKGVSRDLATRLIRRDDRDARLAHALGYLFERGC